MEVIKAEVWADPKLVDVIHRLQEDGESVPNFSLQQGMLWFRGRLVLSKTSTLIPTNFYMIQYLVAIPVSADI